MVSLLLCSYTELRNSSCRCKKETSNPARADKFFSACILNYF